MAGRSAELVPILAARGHAIDVFVDAARLRPGAQAGDAPPTGGVRIISAHDFVWRHARGHYDLPVFQIGNSHLHRFIWPYLFRFPGLAVLHDARLHHARAEALLSRRREDHYRREFAWNHPNVPPAAAEFATVGFGGIFYYQWPFLRGVVESARLVGTHSRGVAALIAREWPHRPVEYLALGEGPGEMDAVAARRDFRAAHQLRGDAVVFGVHGSLTGDKRIHDTLRAFAATLPWNPSARLLLVGAADPWLDLDDHITRLGLTQAVCRIAAADNAEFDRAIAASDVTINLRWPTALETSGPWVRSLALGRPTVIIDMAHHAHVPSLDPRTWRLHAPAGDLDPRADDHAVTVAIDVLDLEHSLRVALRRLGTDAGLRERLGRQARSWWEREHTVEHMTQDYERALLRAVREPLPTPAWPSHMRPDPAAHAHGLLSAPDWQDPAVAARLADF